MKRLAILLVLLTAEAFAAVYPTAQVGEAVKIPHVSTTGTAPFVWSISAGALPPGLALNTATGTISGTAITAGTYQWTLTVKGKAATTWTRTEYMMVVSVPAPPPPPPSPPPPPASTGLVFEYATALLLDGVRDFVAIPDSNPLDLASAGTLEAWVKISDVNRWHGIIAKGNANDDRVHNYALQITNGNRPGCLIGNGSTAQVLLSSAVVVAGTFYHLACVWNGATITLYVDGVVANQAPQGVTPTPNTSPLYLGQFGGDTDRLAGVLDDVRIYNRALTVGEVLADMNTPVSGAQPSPTTATAELSWQPSSPAVAGYNVYRDGARRNASPLNALTYSDGPLPPGIYRYTVRAVDAAGVESVDSGAVAAMVP